MKYNPQKTDGKPYKQMAGKMSKNWKGGLKQVVTNNIDGKRHPVTVQRWNRERGFHPTQKPVAMFEYFIATYTDKNDIVLDPFMGSGTTGMACKKLDREFIGIEMMPEYMEIAKCRIDGVKKEDQLNML